MNTYYINGSLLSKALNEFKEPDKIKNIEFKTIEVDDTYINKYRLIYGEEFKDITLKRIDNTLNIVCRSNDNKVHLVDKISENYKGLFERFEYLENLDLSILDTSGIMDMSYMFYGSFIKSVDLKYLDTSNVVYMNDMFGASSLCELDLSTFDTHNVIDMHEMFGRSYNLRKVDLSNFNTSKVVDMHQMFYECTELKELNLSHFDTHNVVDMESMFDTCRSLEYLDISNFKTDSLIHYYDMVFGCNKLSKDKVFMSKSLINRDIFNKLG